ncbi:MAG: GerMN domain-containing protein [Erysipelotrichaceae bacterium]|nr:GerMN domain-containing protein [Erysipelotrichaceae bacterium]
MRKHLNTKRIIILAFSPILVSLIILGFIFSIQYKNKERNIDVSKPIENVSYSYVDVYLIDQDDTLIPLTVKYESFNSKAEEMMYVISLLKENSIITTPKFKGILPENVTVTSLELNDTSLTLSFDENFKTYDAKKELRLLESIIWTLTDLDYVEDITLAMNNEVLSYMPVNNTPINKKLTRHFGINNLLLTSSIIGSGQKVLSYYEKKVANDYYYVPVTHYVSNKNNVSIYDLTIQTLFKNPGITSSLEVCRCLNETTMMASSILKDQILYLSLSEDILYDELTVSYDVYKIIKEVTCLLDEIKDVAFLMDLEEVKVNGVVKDEQESVVSKIVLNKFYI